MDCEEKLTLLLSVQNGQNGTERVATYSTLEAEGEGGQIHDLEDGIEIELSKTPISIRYSLEYLRLFNALPYEAIVTQDSSGAGYNWFSNPCRDGQEVDVACGWFKGPDGENVPDSQGFCCKCDLADFLGLGGDDVSRANLQCSLVGTTGSQGAHCLRFDTLWYAGYAVGVPQVDFAIEARVTHCPGVPVVPFGEDGDQAALPATTSAECTTRTLVLNPSTPQGCITLPRDGEEGGDDGDPPSRCDLRISLEGDLAPWEGVPSYAHKTLFVPSWCTGSDCLSRMREAAESPDRWMLVDNTAVTLTGGECDKIGVSHHAFRNHGNRCGVAAGSCLRRQLEDLYMEDDIEEGAGRVGNYFLKFHNEAGKISAHTGSEVRMRFQTERYQQTLVHVEMSGDAVRFTRNLAVGRIVSVNATTFEAQSNDGMVSVVVENTGSLTAMFLLSIEECTEGIAPVPGRPLSMPRGSTREAVFTVQAEHDEARNHLCNVVLRDSQNQEADRTVVEFRATAIQHTAGSQGGELEDGASKNGQGTLHDPTCEEVCPSVLNLWCALVNGCLGRVFGFLSTVFAILLLVFLVVRYPRFFLAPCNAGGKGKKRRGRRTRRSPRSRYSRQKRRDRRHRHGNSSSSSDTWPSSASDEEAPRHRSREFQRQAAQTKRHRRHQSARGDRRRDRKRRKDKKKDNRRVGSEPPQHKNRPGAAAPGSPVWRAVSQVEEVTNPLHDLVVPVSHDADDPAMPLHLFVTNPSRQHQGHHGAAALG